ncbi:uncharacterized protein LAJ45_05662 [Morchella importuna]|uniref:Phosphoglycerate mutase-like protein n=1 Tax=Morchella conica CCBAS932 TaxID=1392247 RepID=A0A3N4KBY4_9PEZI|nr:uncharacterized protein LAJ45_05662 [Morchella importuna]KAH8150449.1 hypothetical protein LAJ45_05662 [Morchella importuna]RPB08044.1 phosphoglycerate mutase-like protein [Morchella conica CCBAS932]
MTFLSSLLFFSIVLLAIFSTVFGLEEVLAFQENRQETRPFGVYSALKYTVLDGFFRQSDDGTDDRTYDPLTDSFGLQYSGPRRWERFVEHISFLNENAPVDVSYKVLYLARHGQGHHNVAEHHFGNEAWECYWAMKGNNGTYHWGPDARLTEKGISEVHRTRDAWKSQIPFGVPLPQIHFVSPLSRSLSTLVETWKTIALDPPRPLVNELLRETLSLHYGDHRSPASELRERYPEVYFPMDGSFPEEDPLWNYHRESLQGRNGRIKYAMDNMIAASNETYISMTSHSGVINSTLVALGHRPYNLQTAGMIPVVVKVERDRGGLQKWFQPNNPSLKNVDDSPRVEERVICDGYPPVNVSGLYESGMGVWPWS